MFEQELVAQALETLESLAGGQPIREVEIALGPGVDSAKAAAAWEVLTRNTPFSTTHVTWEQALDLLRCGECGHEHVGDGMEVCPYCGADGVVIEPAAPVAIGRWWTRREPTTSA